MLNDMNGKLDKVLILLNGDGEKIGICEKQRTIEANLETHLKDHDKKPLAWRGWLQTGAAILAAVGAVWAASGGVG